MLTIIAAVAKKNVIGAKNAIPWYLPDDLKHFQKLTSGKTVLMGRKTLESIIAKLGHPLPDRTNIVVTRQVNYAAPEGVRVYHSLEKALCALRNETEVHVIGGGQIYAQAINYADTLEITHVEKAVDGDVYFPAIDPTLWRAASEEKHGGYRFTTYERVGKKKQLRCS